MLLLPVLIALLCYLNVTALDDGSDVLTCFGTAFFFILSAFLNELNTSKKISCWFPMDYPLTWAQTVEDYCYSNYTSWYPINDSIIDLSENYKQENFQTSYYFPSIYFTFAAVISMFPQFVWKLSQILTDMPILRSCETVAELSKTVFSRREARVKELAKLLDCKLLSHHVNNSVTRICPIVVYIFIKILYVVISVLQFIMLRFVLGHKDIFWGYELTKTIFNVIHSEERIVSPHIVFCNFTVREKSGEIHDNTVQCVLRRNEFNEPILLLLWYWLLFTSIATVLDNIFNFIYFNNVQSLFFRIRITEDNYQKIQLDKFINKFLRNDGQLVLSYVKSQSEVVAEELALEMWKIYKRRIAAHFPSKFGFRCDMTANWIIDWIADVDANIEISDR